MVSFLLILYLAVLRLSGFLYAAEDAPALHGVFTDWLYQLTGHEGLWADVLAILLLAGQGIALNALTIEHRLSTEIDLFPGVFYTLAASALPEFLYLSPLHLANTFLIIAIWQLFQTYRRPQCAEKIFNTGFWIAVAGLFYPAYLIFIVLGFVGLNLLRAFKTKEYIMLIAGAFVPYFLFSVYAFWVDQLPDFWAQQFRAPFQLLALRIPGDGLLLAKLSFFGLATLVALLSQNLYYSKKSLQIQKKISLLYWIMFLAGLTLLFQRSIAVDHLLLLAVPIGVLISFNFTHLRSGPAEVVHLLLLASVAFFQFWRHFI